MVRGPMETLVPRALSSCAAVEASGAHGPARRVPCGERWLTHASFRASRKPGRRIAEPQPTAGAMLGGGTRRRRGEGRSLPLPASMQKD